MSGEYCKDCISGDPTQITKQTIHLPQGRVLSDSVINIKNEIATHKRAISSQLLIFSVTRKCSGLPFWHKRTVEPDAKCVNEKAFEARPNKPPQP